MKKPCGIQEQLDKAMEQAVAPENVLPMAMSKSVKRLGLDCDESDLKALINALSNAENGSINID